MSDRTYSAEEVAEFAIQIELYKAIKKNYSHEPSILENAKRTYESRVPAGVRRMYDKKVSEWKSKFEKMFNMGSKLEKMSEGEIAFGQDDFKGSRHLYKKDDDFMHPFRKD